MTTTDLATFTDPGTMSATWQYAETVARASMLPAAYRGKPADVLIAIGLGQAVGIPPAQSLYEIYVVNGRPSPSANLMAALVRRSGHKLRVEGNAESCTATLVRADDPDYPFTATWTIDQARSAGLAGKDTWKQYPAAMLRARAIAEVVRMGASEAVLGMEYAAEEQRDIEDDRTVVLPRKTTGVGSLRDDLIPPAPPAEDVQDAEVVEPDPEARAHHRRPTQGAAYPAQQGRHGPRRGDRVVLPAHGPRHHVEQGPDQGRGIRPHRRPGRRHDRGRHAARGR
jgi:hypothetical protein